MREGINIGVSAADRERLAAVVADRNSPQKHVWRARIILATAEGCGTGEIMRRAGVSKPCVLDGTVIGQCMARHRHQEFIRFLNRIEAAVPAGRLIHAILDNYAAHKHPKVRAWLARHPRWTFHFTPTSCSWASRRLFCYADPPALAARRVPLTRRPASRDQPLPRRAQPQTQTLRLDRRPRSHHRKGQPWIPSVGVRPLDGHPCGIAEPL